MTPGDGQERRCAVCDSGNKKFLFRQQFVGMPGATLLSGYDVVICADCGLGYADDLPGQRVFDEYYERMSKYEYEHQGGRMSDFDVRRFSVTAGFVSAHAPNQQSRILDVGCSNGGMLHSLRQAGYADLTGLDPSPACARMAERLYRIRVVQGALSRLPPELGRYDVVLLAAVLEHVRDLKSALGATRTLMVPHGLLYVEVPDVSRFAGSPDAPFQEFSVEHINYFSVSSLRNLLKASGFEMIQSRQTATTKGDNIVSSEIRAMFRMVDEAPIRSFPRDEETERALTEYIRVSAGVERRIHEALDPWVRTKAPIVVWGVGTHTQRLLATSSLPQANIAAFVDSNARYHGKTLSGIPILPPSALAGRTEPILVSSRFFQKDIERQIRGELKLGNELILLYDV